jgi:hypothetical protein
VDEARREAVITVGELTQDVLRRGEANPQEMVVDVLDDQRKPLMRVAVRFEVQTLF